MLGRAALEYAAVSNYFVRQINERELNGPVFAATSLQRLEELLLRYAHETRFNWPDLFSGNRDGLIKENIARRLAPEDARRYADLFLGNLALLDARACSSFR